jgi:hypothetical protein
MGKERGAFHPGQEPLLQQRPNTFAQTNLSPSLFACDKAADHTFRFARQGANASDLRGDALLLALRRGRGLLRERDPRDGECEDE